MKNFCFLLLIIIFGFAPKQNTNQWIRINLLGYQPESKKVAVWCSKGKEGIDNWELVNDVTKQAVYKAKVEKLFGAYGPFTQTTRLNFSSYKQPGKYFLRAGTATSPVFEIGNDVYKGTADFCLRYMRQQRSGFNPFLKDSCHTQDGYTLYGKDAGLPDSTHIDVSGGWHDASDYLQYSSTSANATYHLLMAYRDFPNVFADEKLSNGLNGKNNLPDVLDEAKWGLDWLLKMHPRDDWMFNQLGDDRDHISMRIPKMDSQYGKGFERPVYFIDGKPQQRGKLMNNTTGTSSTAAKFASSFGLGNLVFHSIDTTFSNLLFHKAYSAFYYSKKKQGVTQTVSVRAPYIYAEENWHDDMELAWASITHMQAKRGIDCGNYFDGMMYYPTKEPITPWLGKDTANHYQWYPFINIGHYETAKILKDLSKWQSRFGKDYKTVIGYYKEGINRVWNKAKQNAFYRGVPFIWCSNNLTVSFTMQCYWYKRLTNDKQFEELEQANFDWLFGCNPWGTSMVYGLPGWGDTPVDPHSAFTHLKNFPIDGGLVDGPVYTSIFNNLIGLKLYNEDEYAAFQSKLAVYHDDYGDYSTNEPTMDGTASLIYLLAAKESTSPPALSKARPDEPFGRGEGAKGSTRTNFSFNTGAIVRGDTSKKQIALVFTGHEFADGGKFIQQTLKQQNIKASFFFTGDFYRNKQFQSLVQQLKKDGHYLGAHSDKHLLYCDWNNRDSLLVT